jgi:hypothetical protein
MKKLFFTALFASGCMLAQPPAGHRGGPGFGPGPGGPGGPGGPRINHTVTGAPYSAVEVTTEQQSLAGGNVIQRQHSTTIARDGQGRVRTESDFTRPGSTTSVKRITISDPVAGYVHEVDPQNKVVTSRAIHAAPNGQLANRQRPAGASPRAVNSATRTADPNVKTEDLGTQSLNGVLASGTRVTRTIPAGTIGNAQPIQSVHETWVSSDLQVPVMIKTVDPRFGTRITQLTNVNRGEPDATLFQAPTTGYTVRQGGGRGPRPPAAGGQIQ